MTRLITALILAASLAAGSALADDGSSTGAKIGTIIKSALDVALPPLGNLIELIFPKPKPTDSATKQDVINNAKSLADAKKLPAVNADSVATKLQGLQPIVKQLRTVNAFVLPTATAREALAKLDVILSQTAVNWTDVEAQWNVLTSAFGQMSKVSSDDIHALVDGNLKVAFPKIQRANDTVMKRAETFFKAKNAAKLSTELRTLGVILDDVQAIQSYLAGDLADGLDMAVKSIPGGQGQFERSEPTKTSLKRVEKIPENR